MKSLTLGHALKVKGRPPRCASCRRRIDGAAVIGEERTPQPEVGDVTICSYCGGALMFDDGPMRTRLLTQEEMARIAAERPEFYAAVVAAEAMRKARDGG
jgi:hypothetical protein